MDVKSQVIHPSMKLSKQSRFAAVKTMKRILSITREKIIYLFPVDDITISFFICFRYALTSLLRVTWGNMDRLSIVSFILISSFEFELYYCLFSEMHTPNKNYDINNIFF